MTLEEALRKVWRATMVEDAAAGELEGQTFPVRTTPKKRMREVDFVFDHQELRGLEQTPRPLPDGHNSPVEDTRSCSFFRQAAMSPTSSTAR